MATKKKNTEQEYDTLSQLWQDRYDLAATNQENLFKKFSRWYDIIYTVYDDSKVAPWKSKVVFPTIYGKVFDLVAKFLSAKPSAQVEVFGDLEEEELEDKAEKAQKKLEYDWDNPCFDEPMRNKLEASLIDATVCGLGVGKVPWSTKKKNRYERMVDENGYSDLTQEVVYEKVEGYNDLIPVNIFNVFIAPVSSNFYSAPWIIIKEFKTLQELEAINEAKGIEFYTNLDKLQNAKTTSDRFASYKASRNRLVAEEDPIAQDKTLKHVAIYECYENSSNMILTFAEGSNDDKDKTWVCIRKQKNPYWHGKYPLIPFYLKKRSHDVWGIGMVETVERLDSAKNSVFNHFMDQNNLATSGGIMAEEASLVNDFEVEPGFELTYRGTKPEQFKFTDPNAGNFQTVMQVLDKEMEDATIDPYATGAPNSATDKTQGTATGIMRLQEAAGDSIAYMRANFKQSIRTLLQMWLSNNQQFMAAPMSMRMNGREGNEQVQISPADLQGEMNLIITDESIMPMSKDDEREQWTLFTQQLQTHQQASLAQAQASGGLTKPVFYDWTQIVDETAEKWGYKDADKFIMSQDEVDELMQQQQQMMMAQAQQEQGMMAEEQAMGEEDAMAEQAMSEEEAYQSDPNNQAVKNMAAELASQGAVDPRILEEV